MWEFNDMLLHHKPLMLLAVLIFGLLIKRYIVSLSLLQPYAIYIVTSPVDVTGILSTYQFKGNSILFLWAASFRRDREYSMCLEGIIQVYWSLYITQEIYVSFQWFSYVVLSIPYSCIHDKIILAREKWFF